MRVQKCKGTRDLSPEEMRRFRFIEDVFRDSCLKWGYQEVRTPTIEYLHLFTSTGTLTPGALSRVYSFLDWDGWSGERVALRPEGTIPAVRLYIDSLSDQKLARLFYIINTFVYEETGKENREKWQCGVELIGDGSKSADAELTTLSLEILRKLGLENVKLRLSHAGIIRALLARFGLSPQEQGKVFGQILEGDTAALTHVKKQAPELTHLLKPLLDKGNTPGFLRNLKTMFKSNLPECASALDNFIEIADFLTAIGQKYEIDIASGRGFEYYTGIIFQLSGGKTKLGGGGRYDALIPFMGGKSTPASGFALHMDVLMNLIKMPAITKAESNKVLIKLTRTQPEEKKSIYELATDLREAGFIVVVQTDNESTADFAWLININANSTGFTVSNRSRKRKLTVTTKDDILKILGKER